jgi:uncharacterized membrane protein YeaQ/YmgE (transglycosylase-associated protein family)
LIILLVVGGVVSWTAILMMMNTDGQQGIFLNIIVGVVGGILAGWFILPMIEVGTINQYNFRLPSLLISSGGAVVLLEIVNLIRRSTVR